jgi:hypothetical protein
MSSMIIGTAHEIGHNFGLLTEIGFRPFLSDFSGAEHDTGSCIPTDNHYIMHPYLSSGSSLPVMSLLSLPYCFRSQ